MKKNSKLGEKTEALIRMEKNDPLKYRSVSMNIAEMVKSLDEQEKNNSSRLKKEGTQA
ncbi:hypothetical protein [Maridesulfovibrio sp. FT414]|uniref:hypothetical protein n=1 Tax=Maridesulfovibrio sp. FT414 TaxID=2979469 RepID=UPI003D803861